MCHCYIFPRLFFTSVQISISYNDLLSVSVPQINAPHNETDKLARGGLDKMTLIEVLQLFAAFIRYTGLQFSPKRLNNCIITGWSAILFESYQDIWWKLWRSDTLRESIFRVSKPGQNNFSHYEHTANLISNDHCLQTFCARVSVPFLLF